MGLLDDVLKDVGVSGDASETDAHRRLVTGLAGILSGVGAGGGLSGLVTAFRNHGLGDVVSSWIANGRNLPVTAEQIQNVLGSAQVQALAARAGISPEMASEAIAKILPHLVDKSTPTGQVPSAGGILDALSGLFR